jgi:hypothetical protein
VNRRILTLLALGAAAAFALAVPLRALPPDTENKYNKSTDTVKTCDKDGDPATTDGGTLTIHAPTKLWPPNHKYYTDVSVTADDAKDGTVELESHGYHDQYTDDTHEELNGSGGGNGVNAGDDIAVNEPETTTLDVNDDTNDKGDPEIVAVETGDNIVTTLWKVRAERSGQDPDGRTYTLSALATFSDGTTCENSVAITVPHDMRKSTR